MEHFFIMKVPHFISYDEVYHEINSKDDLFYDFFEIVDEFFSNDDSFLKKLNNLSSKKDFLNKNLLKDFLCLMDLSDKFNYFIYKN